MKKMIHHYENEIKTLGRCRKKSKKWTSILDHCKLVMVGTTHMDNVKSTQHKSQVQKQQLNQHYNFEATKNSR